MVDIYRKLHPKNKSYTYESKPVKLKSRTDFLLISGKFQPDITKVETRASIAPDRKAVFLSMNLNEVCLEQNILLEYEKLKKELQEIYEEKGRGAIFRSKARWIGNGEKPTKFFFNLERRNYEKRLSHSYKSGKENSCQISNK